MELVHGAEPPELTWRIDALPDGAIVAFSGEIDENADFSDLVERQCGALVFDLGSVRRINSCGVREWVMFQRDLVPASVTVELRACSPTVVAQLNAIANFRGRARVGSFLAPYLCEKCHLEEERLVVVAEDPLHTELPPVLCSRCHTAMTFDEMPERYLSFLREE